MLRVQSSDQAKHYQRATLGGCAKGIGGLSMTLPAEADPHRPTVAQPSASAAKPAARSGTEQHKAYKAQLLSHIGCGRVTPAGREGLARSAELSYTYCAACHARQRLDAFLGHSERKAL